MTKRILSTALCGAMLCGTAKTFAMNFKMGEGDENLIRNPAFAWENTKTLKEWQIKELSLVAPGTKAGNGTLIIQRKGAVSGRIEQTIDVSAYEGKQLFVTLETKVSGGVTPWFEVRCGEGKLSAVGIGAKMVATDVLAELDRFGWHYDFRYGWPVNSDLTHLFREDWQRIGSVFTVPKGAKSIIVQIKPKSARYGLIERRDNPARVGAIELRNPMVAPVPAPEVIHEGSWKQEDINQDAFFYLSYFYNQQQILVTELQMRLWKLERWASWSGNAAHTEELEKIRKALEDSRTALRDLSTYYHERIPTELAKVDLSEQEKNYPNAKASGALTDIGSRRAFYLSLHIQDIVDSGFKLESPNASKIEAGSLAVKKGLDDVEREVLQELKAREDPDLSRLSYADLPAEMPESGLCPPVLYATGNTTSPYRIYKDLKVDLFSKNYPVSTFDDRGLIEDASLPAALERYGLKQVSCLFTPVHGLFAVSDEFLAENQGKWKEFLRADEDGLAPIHARDRKTGIRDVLKLKLDEFRPEAGKSYILPINPLSPKGWEILKERMAMIRQHALMPGNQKTLAAIELSAEPTGIIPITSEKNTRKLYLKFLQDCMGSMDAVNKKYGTKLAGFEELLEAKKESLPEALRIQRDRWDQKFRTVKDAEVYHSLQKETGLKDMAFLHRNNDLYFSDFAWVRSKLKDNFINYHAGWDRVYGYYLGRALGRDHITGEDHPALPTGLKERHTPELAFSNFLKALWGYAAWGTKCIQIWRPYRENAFHSVASFESDYTMINENWSALPFLKNFTRGLGRVLDGEVLTPSAAYLQLEQQGHVTWYMPSIYTTNQFLRREQIGYGYLFEEALEEGKDSLNDYKLIILPPSLFVSQPMQEKLWQWVQAGGTLVLFGPMGLHDKESLPSSWLMDRAFGPADYHLVGSVEQLRRPCQEGLWTIRWKNGKPGQVKTIEVPEEILLPRGVKGLYEKKWNSFDYVEPIAEGVITPDLLAEQLIVATSGKGKVIMVPREFLPNAYRNALAEALGGREYSIARVSEPSFSVMRRRAKGEKGQEEFLFIQNEDELQGRRTSTVMIPGGYAEIDDVSDIKHAVPVAARSEGGMTVFDLALEPGEIAAIRLRKTKSP